MNITRLWTCSPVATRIGATPRAIAAWPRMSSGEVGSSIQYGSNSREPVHPGDRLGDAPALVRVDRHHPVRPDLLADDRRPPPVVVDVRPDLQLERASSPRPAPRGRAAGSCRRRSPASRPTSCRPDTRPAGARPRAPRGWGLAHAAGRGPAPAEGHRRCTGSRRARPAPRASCRRSASRAACPRVFAKRSQTALTTAAVARWITPFSGPIQRSWLSPTSVRQNAPMSAKSSSVRRPTTSGRSASTAATTTSVPRPIVNVRPWPSRPSPASASGR